MTSYLDVRHAAVVRQIKHFFPDARDITCLDPIDDQLEWEFKVGNAEYYVSLGASITMYDDPRDASVRRPTLGEALSAAKDETWDSSGRLLG